MTLNNAFLTIEVSERGAELVSLVKDDCEYLWSGDAAYWNRHAPILFPAVGKPFDNMLHVDGQTYTMKQHGYARDGRFLLIGKDSMMMLPGPLAKKYPFRLGLEVCYSLRVCKVEVVWTVVNRDSKVAYFQIGAHPGFMLPDYRADDAIHGYIRYYDRNGMPIEPAVVSALDDGNRVPLATPRHIPATMPIEADTFAHDALMFEGGQVTKAVLCDKDGREVLGVDCPQADAYGVWAPHKEGCPFVCLEPWCGICDAKGFDGDISERQYIHRLAPKEKYTFAYTIEIYR